MTDAEWYLLATKFKIGYNDKFGNSVYVCAREQVEAPCLYVVEMGQWVLCKDGNFYLERPPSQRTKRYIQRNRFSTKDKAYAAWCKHLKNNGKVLLEYPR